ncbi:tRNA epoxyqueuosine(34) reductase QueG [Leptospira santarosai]|uniref:4Fe-4S ferredoxin n=1 Tax=Leptospira santarosai serovar Shermani str. LT 821 TaxID=758847 RepID=K8Y8K3_9LEPT|nr:tRNA epoxyqueuosine(34) reductase QueG [Leptospira santarosai]EKT86902.1 4Fe-4S ferredoxin [Leptospira santarosai serovar Shermani str. LT 821]EPG82438.1 epoxyqueuosine reductase [Leptospira santarosai serovar Shermani str. 1342KT]MDI7197598.1 tRNA epoxyqueuosine(34) reductase QueG [Leptospira santarosai]MDI7215554.1 tRNA epoxyqueuosine(34) reductase QueG [Leptospira santarosai]MDI7222936.1 tRNA epoxyqueuosine(34) reductase QueG [Leptospira santarosai]
MIESKEIISEFKTLIESSGFDLYGICDAKIPQEDKENILTWVREGKHGKMVWYPKNMDLRLNFKNLGFDPLSAIVLGTVYNDPEYDEVRKSMSFRFSRYAIGEDYHRVLRRLAKSLIQELKKKYPNHRFRQGVDSLPVPEKVLARLAGLGWKAKNTNLIHPDFGSFFFITVILTDLPIYTTQIQVKDRCGTCTACIDACPTGALKPYQIDAGKCISHHTLEDTSETISDTYGWLAGCDICQDVCPWNRVKANKNGIRTNVEEFKARSYFKANSDSLLSLNEREFNEYFFDSAISRMSFKMYLRNLKMLKR